MAKDRYLSGKLCFLALQLHFKSLFLNNRCDWRGDMDDETAFRFNIEHFRSLLATERDEATLRVVRQLLADEEKKLAEALHRKLTKK
jgi:hypothetical protein